MTADAARKDERLARIRRSHGVDWFPTWGQTPIEYWTAEMPRARADAELSLAAAIGFDHVRVWLSAHGYERDPACYLGNLVYLLDRADAAGLGVVFELFDSCGIEQSRGPSRLLPISAIPEAADGSEPLKWLLHFAAGRDLFAAPGLMPVPYRGDALVAVWGGFEPNPGYDLIGEEHWLRFGDYATAVLERIADHQALLLVEVMNEPFVAMIGHPIDRERIVAFYQHMTDLARRVAPSVPLAIGAPQRDIRDHDVDLPDLDVISFHSFDSTASGVPLRSTIATAKEVARGRPCYLSEWSYFPGGPDGEQLAEIERLLPIVEDAGIGWAFSHLIAGYGPFAREAICYPNGVLRPGGLHFHRELNRSPRQLASNL